MRSCQSISSLKPHYYPPHLSSWNAKTMCQKTIMKSNSSNWDFLGALLLAEPGCFSFCWLLCRGSNSSWTPSSAACTCGTASHWPWIWPTGPTGTSGTSPGPSQWLRRCGADSGAGGGQHAPLLLLCPLTGFSSKAVINFTPYIRGQKSIFYPHNCRAFQRGKTWLS